MIVVILIGQQIQKDNHLFNEPDPSYGGAVWGKVVPELTGANIPFAVRARVTIVKRSRLCTAHQITLLLLYKDLETVALKNETTL